MINYYEILKISFNSSEEDIKKQYRKLAKKYHPDINKDKNAYKQFYLITEAYKILSNPATRKEYNKKLFNVRILERNNKTSSKIPVKIIYSRSLGELAKRGFFLSSIPRKYRKAMDIKYDIEVVIDYKDFKKEKIVAIDIPTKLPCPACGGIDSYCPLCDGKGYIVRSTRIKFKLPEKFVSGEILEIDLRKIKQKNLAVFRANKLRIKIIVSGKKNQYKQLNG